MEAIGEPDAFLRVSLGERETFNYFSESARVTLLRRGRLGIKRRVARIQGREVLEDGREHPVYPSRKEECWGCITPKRLTERLCREAPKVLRYGPFLERRLAEELNSLISGILSPALERAEVESQTQDALAGLDEEALAYEAGLKKARRLEVLEWNEFRKKLSEFLARRGFPYSVIAPTVSRIWNETHAEQNTIDNEEIL